TNKKISKSILHCCHTIYYNDCLQNECSLLYNEQQNDRYKSKVAKQCSEIYLVTTDLFCLSVLRQPVQFCDIDISITGQAIIHYSDCRFQMIEFLREYYGPPEQWLYDENGLLATVQSFRKQCCLTYTSCYCYDKYFQKKCQQNLLTKYRGLSDKKKEYYCRCPGYNYIKADAGDEEKFKNWKKTSLQKQEFNNCTIIIENECQWMIPENRKFLLEYRDIFSFNLYVTIITTISTLLFCSFCRPYGKNILNLNIIKRWWMPALQMDEKLKQDIQQQQELFERKMITAPRRLNFMRFIPFYSSPPTTRKFSGNVHRSSSPISSSSSSSLPSSSLLLASSSPLDSSNVAKTRRNIINSSSSSSSSIITDNKRPKTIASKSRIGSTELNRHRRHVKSSNIRHKSSPLLLSSSSATSSSSSLGMIKVIRHKSKPRRRKHSPTTTTTTIRAKHNQPSPLRKFKSTNYTTTTTTRTRRKRETKSK
uniref:Uncharacterized protein LOC113792395 n=1 Tax=Dermatophagoides pteronyssinus TaxID=6956 RepID=A0A6P6XYG0_DERPT